MELGELRQSLDALDTQMVSLLTERAKIIMQVGAFKRQHNIPVHIPEREAAIIARLQALNAGPLSGEALERIYRTIFEEMRRLENKAAPH